MATRYLYLAASFLFQCETTLRDTIEAVRLIEQWKNLAEKRTKAERYLEPESGTALREDTPKRRDQAADTFTSHGQKLTICNARK